MGQQSAKNKEISLGDDFGDVTVKANGTAVVIRADGAIEDFPLLRVVRRQRSALDDGKTTAPAEPKIGDNATPHIGAVMPDGTVFAGISPDTNKPMYASPTDASLTMTFNQAQEYAQGLNLQKAHGQDDWRVPTKNELDILFNNRAAIGGFGVSGSDPAGWYWSSSQYVKWNAWGQRFSDGYQGYYDASELSSVRCVR
jgi:hypothetical protein